MTYDRSQIVDFSRPYFVNNVGLAVLSQPLGFFDVMMSMFGDAAMHLLIGFLVLLVILHICFTFRTALCGALSGRIRQRHVRCLLDNGIELLRDVLYDPVSGVVASFYQFGWCYRWCLWLHLLQ